jgi:putative photosynthetic complex assembly protein 2
MQEHALAIVSVIVSWWFSTGIVMLMNGRPPQTFQLSAVVSLVAALCGVAGLVWSSAHATTAAAYVGFGSAILVWAFHELSFLLGLISGPNKAACPPELRGVPRFVAATATLIHHELLLFATLVALVALTWGAPNQVGTLCFAVLWFMRISAKLNLFVGVPHINLEFIPARMRYLTSYFGPARLTLFLPTTLVIAVATSWWLLPLAGPAPIAATLVGTLLALGVVEHVFLAVPMGDAALWRWASRNAPLPVQNLEPQRDASPPALARAARAGRGTP